MADSKCLSLWEWGTHPVVCSLPQLIHGTVVDTAIVFPHRLGLPYKRALRTLMADYLKRIIQDNGETSQGSHFLLPVVSSAPAFLCSPQAHPLAPGGMCVVAGNVLAQEASAAAHFSVALVPRAELSLLPSLCCGKAEGGSAKARSCLPFSLWPAEMDPPGGSGACSLLSPLSTLNTAGEAPSCSIADGVRLKPSKKMWD